jgi:hypothetical protein
MRSEISKRYWIFFFTPNLPTGISREKKNKIKLTLRRDFVYIIDEKI